MTQDENATDKAGSRPVSRIVDGQVTMEGAGFKVRRPFPTRGLNFFDPFLLLDEMGPADHGPGEGKGAPDHPHRGFETVTYVLSGEMQHKDSTGRTGLLGPGDVQWMTAGFGVVHSEMPSEKFQREGGRMHGFQLWVNLPAKDKLMPPRYQEFPSAGLPTAGNADGTVTVKVLAGEAYGVQAVIETRTPILYLHFTLKPGARAEQAVPEGFNVCAYLVSGAGNFGPDGTPASEGQLALFGEGAGGVEFDAGPDGLELLLLGGKPLNEPVARYGPFVMNTQQELMQAVEDFQAGRMGEIRH